jgi:hypothetical protein
VKRISLILLALVAIAIGCSYPVSAHVVLTGEVPCGSALKAAGSVPEDPYNENETTRLYIANCHTHGRQALLAGGGAAAALLVAAVLVPGRRKKSPAPLWAPPAWGAGFPPPPPLPLPGDNSVPGQSDRHPDRAPGPYGSAL